MKKPAIAIAMMTLILTGTTWAQRQKNFGSTAMGSGSGVGVHNRRPTRRSLYANNIGQGVHAEAQDGSGTDNANRQRGRRPNAIGNPFGLGGTVTAGVKNRQSANLGDTATHEVGHKGTRRNPQFRPPPAGDGTTEHFRQNSKPQTAQYNPKEVGIDKSKDANRQGKVELVSPSSDPHGAIQGGKANVATYNGISGGRSTARTKNPIGRR